MHAAVQKKKKGHFNMKIVHHEHENNVFDCRGVFLYKYIDNYLIKNCDPEKPIFKDITIVCGSI
jgi:hypothetical protein